MFIDLYLLALLDPEALQNVPLSLFGATAAAGNLMSFDIDSSLGIRLAVQTGQERGIRKILL